MPGPAGVGANTHPATWLEELGIPTSVIDRRALSACEQAGRLVVAETGRDGRAHRLTPEASAAWARMKGEAQRAGVVLYIVSAYRSVERQARIIRRKLNRGQRIEDILLVSAPPGYSEHHTGRAVDIGTRDSTPLEIGFDRTPAFAWLRGHAPAFGFRLSYPPGNPAGYRYEPWHWLYLPPPGGEGSR